MIHEAGCGSGPVWIPSGRNPSGWIRSAGSAGSPRPRWRSAAAGERRAEEAVDRRGVVGGEVVRGEQGRWRRRAGRRWERQDLKPGVVEGDEVLVDEAIANDEVVVQRQLERGADPVVGVEADAVTIAGEDEEEV